MLRATILGASMLLAASAGASAAAPADPLSTPSILSPHSTSLLMTRVIWTGERLVSLGERGTILLSDDLGATWRQVLSPVRTTLTAAAFPSPKVGWVVGNGGIVLSTGDGGESWVKAFDGQDAAAMEKAQAQADLALMPDNARAQRRVREAEALVTDGPDKPFLDIRFFDQNRGLIVGAYGLAFRTEDAGRHWFSIMGRIDNPDGRHLYGIATTATGIFLVGEQGTVFRSTDAALSFQALAPVGRGTLFGIVAGRSGTLVAYGLRGALFRSADDGTSWTRIGADSASINGGTLLSDGTIALVDDAGNLKRSRDDGRSFATAPLPRPMPFSALEQTPDGTLVLAGPQGNLRLTMATDAQGKQP